MKVKNLVLFLYSYMAILSFSFTILAAWVAFLDLTGSHPNFWLSDYDVALAPVLFYLGIKWHNDELDLKECLAS